MDHKEFKDLSNAPGFDCSAHTMVKLGVIIDKENMKTIPDESEIIDLDELAESYRDTCGLAAVLRAVQQGKVDPSTLKDDGQHGVDFSAIPDNLNDAYQKQLALKGALANVEAQLGIDAGTLTAENYAEVIKSTVDNKIKAATATAKPEEE